MALLCLAGAACGAAPEAETAVGPRPTSPSSQVEASVPIPTFSSSVAPVTAADLAGSWRPGCPVSPAELRLVRVSHWGFDARTHDGALVVNATGVEAIVEVFRHLFDQRFPIRRMETIDVFGGDDDASMAADNTSAFNCRNAVSIGPPRWSTHAYGLAIDVNPVENPYLLGSAVLPPAGRAYVDRSTYRDGMAVDGGVLTAAFASVGWSWGGTWGSPDYQHFSATGR